jgi:hypothetical protein
MCTYTLGARPTEPGQVDMSDTVAGDWRNRVTEAVLAESTGYAGPVNRHLPVRPEWTCKVDRKPWPCPGARVHLRSQFVDDRVGLAVYMSTQLMTAAVDLTDDDVLPPDLFNRFMAWT